MQIIVCLYNALATVDNHDTPQSCLYLGVDKPLITYQLLTIVVLRSIRIVAFWPQLTILILTGNNILMNRVQTFKVDTINNNIL